jgi:ABC-type multidrug transport system fused ATPase/permease subunit
MFTLGVISFGMPLFIVLILPLAGLYWWIQKYYLRTSRELKRLESVSRSPVYAHFQESLSGISTIRAYRQTKRFSMENEWRVDANLRAYYPSISANRWLAVRLEFIGSIIILAAASFAIISVTTGSGISAGIVGLAMSYGLQITQSLNWIVRQTVEVETNIVSVERVLEYAALKSEAPEVISKNRPPNSWPSKGAVAFNNYSTRYRDGLDLVLKNVSLNIKSHEKIGVVGRTGAGKSSLTLALFRIIEGTEGNVTIDGLNTGSIGLLDLRGRLAIIPQDAALFEGSVRDNLDPGHVHDDTELWSVLAHARLRDHVASMSGQLDARINEGGSNLSQGQRQLVSLARALLTPSNILVLDEATAAVDVETDALLQTTLRSPMFKDRTIITSKFPTLHRSSHAKNPADIPSHSRPPHQHHRRLGPHRRPRPRPSPRIRLAPEPRQDQGSVLRTVEFPGGRREFEGCRCEFCGGGGRGGRKVEVIVLRS